MHEEQAPLVGIVMRWLDFHFPLSFCIGLAMVFVPATLLWALAHNRDSLGAVIRMPVPPGGQSFPYGSSCASGSRGLNEGRRDCSLFFSFPHLFWLLYLPHLTAMGLWPFLALVLREEEGAEGPKSSYCLQLLCSPNLVEV